MRIASNKIKDVIRFFREELLAHYDEAEIETFIAYCFEEFLSIKRFQISLKTNETISESELLKFNFAVKDLKNKKPIQHILGKADFYGMKFIVNEHVLIPRPETEELVHLIINENKNIQNLNANYSALDIGTGTGCIAIAIKTHLPQVSLSAIDISDNALSVAMQNAAQNNVQVNFYKQDILSDFYSEKETIKKFDIIVSNPPYVTESEKMRMQTNVLNYEPHLALFVPDNNPLVFYKAITAFALQHLKPQGKLYFEINEFLAEETKIILEKNGFKDVDLLKDINGKSRILRGSI